MTLTRRKDNVTPSTQRIKTLVACKATVSPFCADLTDEPDYIAGNGPHRKPPRRCIDGKAGPSLHWYPSFSSRRVCVTVNSVVMSCDG
ncbi:hypothetical protein HPB47_023914 [Ixodes persulcatus]|uniref:Uncharacterized protein n=1 Tax=Ixodes persulcatus TaxID=34615 RepID=A0AC60QZH0_IXOPE|nr:hypothetical protein HPB47_023914 [Ixodes persulcatus]